MQILPWLFFPQPLNNNPMKMKRRPLPRFILFTIILCQLAIPAGCKVGMIRQDKHALLQERINHFLKAQNSGDLERLYGFYTQEFRSKVNLMDFMKNNSGVPVEMALFEIYHETGSDTATVIMKGQFNMLGFDIHDIKLPPQNWVYENEEWFVKADPPVSMEELFRNNGQPRRGKP